VLESQPIDRYHIINTRRNAMILTTLNALSQQADLTPEFEKAIKFLSRPDLDDMPDGRVDIDGDKVYALIQTKPSIEIKDLIEVEGHKRYIDIHYISKGEEIIGWINSDGIEPAGAYQEIKDVWKTIVPKKNLTMAKLSTGLLMVCYPSDAHAPLLLEDECKLIRKYVMKVAV